MKRVMVCFLVVLGGCIQDMPPIPADVLPIAKMKVIMADLHIADAVAATKLQEGMDEKLLASEYYLQIFKNNGITREEFAKSYRFYEANPKLYNKLYEAILGEISKREAQLGK